MTATGLNIEHKIFEAEFCEDFSSLLETSISDPSHREAILLEERTRIARELHDTFLQTFLSAAMQLGAALERVPAASPFKAQLDHALQLIDQGIADSRSAIQDLRSREGRPLDLVLALSRVWQDLPFQPDIEFRLIVTGRERHLHPFIGYEAYRVAREALLNAFRHSHANRVELELEYASTRLRVIVRDNGCGIDSRLLHAGRRGHWGLLGMRERAARIGGRFSISSSAAAGTEVELSIPNDAAFEPLPLS